MPPSGGDVHIQVFTPTDRRIFAGTWKGLATGWHEFPVSFDYADNGLYFALVEVAGNKTIEKWAVMR